MAYFCNGSTGDMWQEKNCDNCMNWRDVHDGRGPGCPIWDLHQHWNYDQFRKAHPNKAEAIKTALDWFVPMSEDGIYPAQCKMYLPAGPEDIEGQGRLFDGK